MRDLHMNTANCLNRIGELLQKIHNLDHTTINLKNGMRDGGSDDDESKGQSPPTFFSDKNPQSLQHVVDLDSESQP